MAPNPSASPGRPLPAWEPPFVGRETPMGALISAVQAAELGERVLALVAGEPGIGKTRLLTEVGARVDAQLLWAGCWDGDGAPAYWPWVQLARGLRGQQATGTSAGLEALLDAPGVADVAGGRFRLFDEVTEAFAIASQRRALVLVLEDLHWADEASIRLLEFVSRDLRPRRLAILGTYRDTDLGASHPLTACIGDLVRDGLHLTLGGLGRRDVAALVGAPDSTGDALAGMVPLLHRKSGGNPFFLRELGSLLRAEGRLDEGVEAGAGSVIPAGIASVVARRVGRLTPRTQDALVAAAVAAVEVDPALLAAVTDLSALQVSTALEEARGAGLIVEGAEGSFGFGHALVREVLYDRCEPARRAALHAALADAIESRHGAARVAEVAHHLLQAGAGRPSERAVDLAVQAAERSLSALAYEEAAAWYGRALDALAAEHRGRAREADLLLGRGEARLAAGDLPAARDAFAAAAGIARAGGDAERLARAALGLGAGFGGFEVAMLDPLQVDLLEEALGALGPGPSRLRAWVLARLSVALSFTGAEERRLALSEQAVAMARELREPAVLGYALAGHCDAIAGPDHCETRLAEATEVVRLAREVTDRQLELLGRRLRVVALLELGEIAAVDAEIEQFALVADRMRQPLYRWYVPLWRGMRELMRGDTAAATRHCAEAESIGALAHSHNAAMLTFTAWWVRMRYEGRFAEAGEAIAGLLEPEPGAPAQTAAGWPYPAIVAAQRGQGEQARTLLEQWNTAGLRYRPQDSEWLPESAQLAQVAVLLQCKEVAETLYSQLAPHESRVCVEGIGAAVTGSVSWYLADLARFLGRAGDAAAHADAARAAHARIGLHRDPPALAVLDAPPAPAPASPVRPAAAALVREGATWAVTYAGETRRLRESKGLLDITALLRRPGQEVHCLELMGGADVGAEAGPVIDQQARRAYERRIRDLQADIDEARAANDPARAERAEDELDALVRQLSEAFGFSGRGRATGSAGERARSAVGWRIRAALRQAAEAHPALGRHLQNAIRTGTWCSYQPEAPIRWEIDQGRNA